MHPLPFLSLASVAPEADIRSLSSKSHLLATRRCLCTWLVLAVPLVLIFSRCAHAGDVPWVWCSEGNWTSDECWGGFSEPDSTDTANIYVGELSTATTARVYIRPLNDITVKNIRVYTLSGDENSYVDHLGGDMWVLDDLLLGGKSGDTRYLLKGGTFRSENTFVFADSSRPAIFRQSGGESTIDNSLFIGSDEPFSTFLDSDSSYELQAGRLNTDKVFIGGVIRQGFPPGTFSPEARIDQTGGEHTNTGYIMLGDGAGKLGAYRLDAGTLNTPQLVVALDDGEGRFENRTGRLNAGRLNVGNTGVGKFVQLNNVNAKTFVSEVIGIAGTSAANGSNLLVEEGYFETPEMVVGYGGRGSYSQNGGNVHVTGCLFISQMVGSSGSFVYLNGGSLTTGSVVVGRGEAGSFGQRRGVHT